MAILSTLVVRITGDSSGFDQTAKDLKTKAQGIQKSFTSTGLKMTAGLTVPIFLAGKAAVGMASDYDESMSKVNVVFGDAASIVHDFASTSAQDMGISAQAALEAAGTYGNLFTTMGLGKETAAEMSTDLVQLAADLGSFNNMDADMVLGKLQAGLTGEFTALKSMGINLNAAAVDAFVLDNQMQELDGTISEAARLQARYALILGQTTVAQGDYARTADGLSNTQKTVNAQFADVGRMFGDVLLPLITQLASKLGELAAWFANLSPGVKKAIVIFLVIAAVLGPLLLIFGAIAGAVSSLAPVFAVIGAAVGAVSAPVLLLIGAIVLLGLAIWKFGPAAWETIKTIGKIIGVVFTNAWNKIKEFFGNIKNIDWGQLGANIIAGIANGIKNGLGVLATVATTIGSTLIDGVKGFLGINSPSVLAMKEVGIPTGEGVGVGFGMGMQSMIGEMGSSIMGSINQSVAGGSISGSAGGTQIDKIEVNNPIPEPASTSINRELQKLSFLGAKS